jgi:type IV fimbrial biogenesis protein FimT
MNHRQDARRSTQRGVTLIESLSVLTVLALALGVTAPSIEPLRQRIELLGAAAQLETDLQLARSQAVALNRTVHLTLRESSAGTCYLIHTGPAASCSCSPAEAARCGETGEVLRAVAFAADARVQIRSAVKSLTFDPVKGTVTPTATLRAEAKDGRALHQVVNLLGRVRTCSPAGALPGEKPC